jgi:hypothetical protein
MSRPIWDSSALSEVDSVVSTVEYVGDQFAASLVICGTTTSASIVVRAIARSAARAGDFLITFNTVMNPTEYANGDDPVLKPLRLTKIPVFRIGNAALVPFDPRQCPRSIVPALYDALKPTDVVVLDSGHASLFMGEPEVPSLYFLSPSPREPKFPVPNSVPGLAAGLLVYAELFGARCQVMEVIEEDFGATPESLRLWIAAIGELIDVDAEAVLAEAMKRLAFKASTLCGIYS